MELKDFAYWLQGYFELTGVDTALTVEQVNLIKNHLALVFQHDIDPKAGDAEKQAVLNKIHNGGIKEPISRHNSKDTLYRC